MNSVLKTDPGMSAGFKDESCVLLEDLFSAIVCVCPPVFHLSPSAFISHSLFPLILQRCNRALNANKDQVDIRSIVHSSYLGGFLLP